MSPNSTPGNRLRRRKKNEILMSDLVQEQMDYGGGEGEELNTGGHIEDLNALQKLYSSEIDFDNFEVIKVIGRGSYAKVYLIKRHMEGQPPEFFALKVLKKKDLYDKNLMHHTLQERSVLLGVQHPFVVSLHYAFQSPERIYFVLDYVNGGELFYHLRKKVRFSEKEVRFYAAEMILALDHLHSMGFIYRDIKPENILLDSDGHLKLTDFGLSKAVGNEGLDKTNTMCGTAQYLAPEVILKKGYNKMVDWWGLGILIFEMAVGQPPFNNRSNMIIMNDIVHEPFEARDWLSSKLQNLLYLLLEKKPSKRLGSPEMGGIQTLKNHPFFEGIDWDKVIKREYTPPIRPKVKNSGDTRHISKAFLDQEIKNTPQDSSLDMDLLKEMHFDNFTYCGKDLHPSIAPIEEDASELYFDAKKTHADISVDNVEQSNDVVPTQ